ncbi:MAG: hypothetical protein N5P05_003523 [Chroococcopsis gigantea SAG 12.99]|jgi:F0F1-type ATP synthase assembly protein I|nr:hypothetical protein [Chlorogloea purpurea SAG 13.99]MDV3001917.1 hypothetical protein [Chroococcopsis gigantea SAG 12.99]
MSEVISYGQHVIGKFPTESEAQKACQTIEGAGYSPEDIKVIVAPLPMKLDANQSQLVEGAKGGAMAGAVCGALIGYTIGLLLDSASGNSYVNPLLTMLFGSGVGAAGLSVIAALSGSAAPKQEEKSSRALDQEYRIIFTGDENEVNRLTDIIRQTDAANFNG